MRASPRLLPSEPCWKATREVTLAAPRSPCPAYLVDELCVARGSGGLPGGVQAAAVLAVLAVPRVPEQSLQDGDLLDERENLAEVVLQGLALRPAGGDHVRGTPGPRAQPAGLGAAGRSAVQAGMARGPGAPPSARATVDTSRHTLARASSGWGCAQPCPSSSLPPAPRLATAQPVLSRHPHRRP